jgi:ATP adenylyltransferase
MDRIWTPWRLEYIRNLKASGSECVFCRILAESADRENLVLFRNENIFALLNLFPYTSGHILIVVNRHISRLGQARPVEMHNLIDLAGVCEHALQQEFRPEGFNLGFNLGHAAGAGVAHHLHMHVVPRWTGDSNFLSVTGETRVLPEELAQTYRRLHPYFSANLSLNLSSKPDPE